MSKRRSPRSGRRAAPRRSPRRRWRRCAFLGLTLIVGIVSRALLFAPGIGFVAWLAANAYLLGREYFELAAMRFHSGAQASALRRHHAGLVFVCGAMIAVFVAIPLVDLLTPLFATTLMVRLHKRIARVG